MRWTIALAAASAAVFISGSASAQQCAPLPAILPALQSDYGETPYIRGVMADGNLLVITAAPGGGFSVLIVRPDGMACMVATGEGLEVLPARLPGTDS